jgi:hypothetical protein
MFFHGAAADVPSVPVQAKHKVEKAEALIKASFGGPASLAKTPGEMLTNNEVALGNPGN